MGRHLLPIVTILFASACGSGVQSEDSGPPATENPAPDRGAGMGRNMAEPSGTTALTAGTSHYRVEFRSWIPQYWLVDPATGGLTIPYAASLAIPNFSNCYDPGWFLAPITTVYSRFVGDNHVGYDGSYRTSTVVDFDWNGSSISNYKTTLYVGTSHRVLDYWWPGGWWWSGGSTECWEARTGNVYGFPSSASGANFTFATWGSDSFLPPGYGLGDPLFGQLWGAFSGGNLTLTWNTGQFPSFGFQVQATGQPTYTKTVNDVWGLGSDISSPLYVPIIGAKLNCWPLHCNYASVTIPAPVGSSCAHPLCSTGVPLTSSCSSCAAAVCSHDPYCCSVYWDSICVSEVPTYCGMSCP